MVPPAVIALLVLPVALLALYLGVLGVFVAFPRLQPWVVYFHWVRIPLFADLTKPEAYGLRVGQVRNLRITASDGVGVGAWHVLPDDPRVRESKLLVPAAAAAAADFEAELAGAERVFLYFHGNAGNRAHMHRVDTYKTLARTGAKSHVIAIDYRGFGDSDNVVPTEQGVLNDTLAAWDYARRFVPSSRIIVVGHSLGTGITFNLCRHLQQRQPPEQPRGIILLAAFTSLLDASKDYPMFPLLRPLARYPTAFQALQHYFVEKMESYQTIQGLALPILLLHGRRDWEINVSHSYALLLDIIAHEGPSEAGSDETLGAGRPSVGESPLLKEDVPAVPPSGLRIPPADTLKRILASHESVTTIEKLQGTVYTRRNKILVDAAHASHNDLMRSDFVVDCIAEWVHDHI